MVSRARIQRLAAATGAALEELPLPERPGIEYALLPDGTLAEMSLEAAGDHTSRLALQEELKALPWGAVWDYYCETQGAPVGESWLAEVKRYEADVLSKRG